MIGASGLIESTATTATIRRRGSAIGADPCLVSLTLRTSGMRSSSHSRSTFWRHWPLVLAVGAAGCGDSAGPTPPPVRVLERSTFQPPVVDLFAEQTPLEIAPRKSVEQPPMPPLWQGLDRALAADAQSVESSPVAVEPVTVEPRVTRAAPAPAVPQQASMIEPLPSVGVTQLASAVEYPMTDAPVESAVEPPALKPEAPTPEASTAPVSPVVLSNEPLFTTPASPAPSAPSPGVSGVVANSALSANVLAASVATPRPHEAAALTNQAAVEFRKGVELATRGSLFAARNQFLKSLTQLAQAADAQSGQRTHEPAWNAAQRAIEEMEDFASRRGAASVQTDLTLLVRSHQTKAIALDEAGQLASTEAFVRYMQFAKQRLHDAFGGSPAAASALHAVGRVYDSLADQPSLVAAHDKARLFYESALNVDPSQAAAANDLGVLLARHGRLNEAQSLLTHSLGRYPTSAGYHNLAVVQERLGQPQLAAQARQAAQARSGAAGALADPALAPWQNVRWLETQRFAQTSQVASDPRPAATSAAASTTAATATSANTPSNASPLIKAFAPLTARAPETGNSRVNNRWQQ